MEKKKPEEKSQQESLPMKKPPMSPEKQRIILDLLSPGEFKVDDAPKALGLKGEALTEDNWNQALVVSRKIAKDTLGLESAYGFERALETLQVGLGDQKFDGKKMTKVLSQLKEMGPRDAVEGMAFAQMLLLQETTARILGFTNRSMPIKDLCKMVATANACTQTFLAGMEAIQKHRSGGKQQINVNHMHLSPGAQAAVSVGGDVKGGRGGNLEQSSPST